MESDLKLPDRSVKGIQSSEKQTRDEEEGDRTIGMEERSTVTNVDGEEDNPIPLRHLEIFDNTTGFMDLLS